MDGISCNLNNRNTKLFITGATGLIGSAIVRFLLKQEDSPQIIMLVRNREKAKTVYNSSTKKIKIVEGDLLTYDYDSLGDVDYIIHCASPTEGKYMTDHPLETYILAYQSTFRLLDWARQCNAKGFVYVSSLEYYGQILDDRVITEDMIGYVDPSSPRSSYPLGKRAAEYLCKAFAHEYDVPAKIARLTQTFGPGVSKEDNRVFAQFARSIIAGKDIILHTTGESAKPYCHTQDCADAILQILIKGKKGEAYNVANPNTYISIRDMAEFLRNTFNPNINVRIEHHPEMGYAPVTKLHLSADKLMSLGWEPNYGLKEMFEDLIEAIKD